ncbi:hypothetical protein OPKNFCMD_4202 [Methylobacterium crusticola]|uniref:Uncharacterized protein n=1 Tax=Methylobacterium crusticola TaxID=1697972 RepID=A0ABQ4R1G4_9HYPH|nr:hypothetical protein [Methylobacterium crusticola]GJD51448.1 hypothetical protein OPKNFCMD_4202 [Methylobacterium crusticola]
MASRPRAAARGAAVLTAARGAVLAAALPAALAASPAAAQFDVFDNPSVLSLPTTLRATVRVPVRDVPAGPADTLAALYPALAACWRPPAGLARGAAITARFGLRRDGSLEGTPRITFVRVPAGQRAGLVAATLDAVARCTPARLTGGLGGALAGRPIALRFLFTGQTQGVRP